MRSVASPVEAGASDLWFAIRLKINYRLKLYVSLFHLSAVVMLNNLSSPGARGWGGTVAQEETNTVNPAMKTVANMDLIMTNKYRDRGATFDFENPNVKLRTRNSIRLLSADNIPFGVNLVPQDL